MSERGGNFAESYEWFSGVQFPFRSVVPFQECRSDASLRSVDDSAACMGALFSPSVGASLVDAR